MNADFRMQVWKSGFKPSSYAVEVEDTLRNLFGLQNRYDAGRLCLGRSLAKPFEIELHQPISSYGKPIPGEHLFGEEIDLWICLFIQEGGIGPLATLDDFRNLVEAHWNRGAMLLSEDMDSVSNDETRMLLLLSDMLPTSSTHSPEESGIERFESEGEVIVKLGSISRTHPSGNPVEFSLNGQGTSPNMALMGKMGSGKTRTGFHIARQIINQSHIPILLIDPKGDFTDGSYSEEIADSVPGIKIVNVGNDPIPLDFLPHLDVGSASIHNAAMALRDSISLCCRGAGDVQKDILRKAILEVVHNDAERDLKAIQDCYVYELEKEGKKHDSIVSRLNELNAMTCFEPTKTPEDFFTKSWVISLKNLQSEELKKLVILLLLDSFRAYILSKPDAPLNTGFRSLRNLLFIDEARRILAQKRYESLVDIVRQGRAKGIVTMLISQDPSDFHGQADDFTTQLGSVVAFACSQTTKGLSALQGAYGRKLQAAEFSDTSLDIGVAFAKIPNRKPEKIRCWEPI